MNSEIKYNDEVDDGKDESLQNQSNADGENIADENENDESSAIRSGTSNDPKTSKQTPPKGYGLRKWRRFRRDSVKDGSFSADSGLILKRRLSINDLFNSRGEHHKLKNDASLSENDDVASVESQTAVLPLSTELGALVDRAGFSVGADSGNSDDRSSRVSTAASGPRLRNESIGFRRERSRVRNLRSQRGRGGVDHSKKHRGGKIRFEKENSLSSVESDLRSSNAAFTRWGSLSTNGKHGNSVGVEDSEEIRSGYSKENGGAEILSKDKLAGNCLEKENSRNDEITELDLDPFVGSIALLKATQEALENEIQQLVEIGKLSASTVAEAGDQYEETEGTSSSPLHDAYFIDSNTKIRLLEWKLEEVLTALKEKEFRVLELEALLGKALPPATKEVKSDIQFRQKVDNNTEFEDTLQKRMEAEVEYLILSRKAQNLKILAEDQMDLLQEHKSLAEDQIRTTSKLIDAERNIVMLARHAKELEASCMEFLEVKEVLKLLSPSSGVVPT